MMTGFQAEENLTGRAPKKCAKNSGRYRNCYLIYFHSIESVTVQDRLVIEEKIHDSFIIHGVPMCQSTRSSCRSKLLSVYSFGFLIPFLVCIGKIERNRGTSASDGIYITRDRRVSVAHIEVTFPPLLVLIAMMENLLNSDSSGLFYFLCLYVAMFCSMPDWNGTSYWRLRRSTMAI